MNDLGFCFRLARTTDGSRHVYANLQLIGGCFECFYLVGILPLFAAKTVTNIRATRVGFGELKAGS